MGAEPPEETFWDHEMIDEGEKNDRVVFEDLDAAYHMLEELKETMIEAEGEIDWTEEIDRNNAKQLIKDLEAIERVRDLFLREMDPR
jgi:hypothetical protein